MEGPKAQGGEIISLFEDVKSRVTVSEAVRAYGYAPNRAGFICCPFHGEKTASLKVWPDHFHCFGCGASGSVIDFVAMLHNLKPIDAARRLNSDFRLGLDDGCRAPDPAKAAEIERAREAKRLFEDWREDLLRKMGTCIRYANQLNDNLFTLETLTDEEAYAIRSREIIEYYEDILSSGTDEEQLEFMENRKEVETRCSTILKLIPIES